MKKIILGIDPGKKGAIAFLPLDSNGSPTVIDMPENEYDLLDILAHFAPKIYRCFIEKQQPFPKQGLSSTFAIAKHYGTLLGILVSLKIPLEEIPPYKWQKAILGNGKKNRGQSKKLSLEKAKKMFPCINFSKKHGRSDAILIAEYGRRLLFGGKSEVQN